MVRKTKWIENSASDEQVDEVARRALTGRLDFVWHYLARAAADDHEPEDVHQLRVATRRAVAALQIFEALLPPRRARKMNKQLKRIRRAAADARDLDVLAARLKKDPPSHDVALCAELQHFINTLRHQAQPPIEKLHKHLVARDRFARRAEALIDRVRVRAPEGATDNAADDATESHTFAEAARQGFGPLVDEFFAAAALDLNQPEALHGLRICGKRVRYAMEVFVSAFGPAMRQEIYPMVAEIQEKLGKINDHVTAARLYGQWLDQASDAAIADLLRPLIVEEEQAIDQGRHDFLAWWTPGRSADLRRRFDDQFADRAHERSA